MDVHLRNIVTYLLTYLVYLLFSLQSRSSSGSDYSAGGGGSSGFSGGDGLSSAYQRGDSSPSRLTYENVKAPYLHDSSVGSKLSGRSSYYGGSSSYGAGGYDSSYKPRDSPYPGSAPSGKQY